MAELRRAQCSRRGYLTHLKKLLRSAEELLSTAEPLGDDNVVTLRDLNEQLQRKYDLITTLNVTILEATEGDEIKAEVLQSEETTSTISAMKARIINRLNPTAVARTTSHATLPPPTTEHHADHTRDTTTRLPKLNLPQFSGNPLNWQPFWDCFQAAVDSNRSLTGVQKLSCLRAQLRGEASRAIAGFQLTNTSYDDSVQLLRDRFGESFRQVDAHTQALIDLPGPTNTYSQLLRCY